MNKKLLVVAMLAMLGISGCQEKVDKADPKKLEKITDDLSSSERLKIVLDANAANLGARYNTRNPQKTLEFFGIEPGMTVVEALPGGGWYSKILLPYLGSKGQLIGVDYPVDLYSLFSFYTKERIEAKKDWVATWTADAEKWRSNDSASIKAFQFRSLDKSMAGTADAVLFIRALHNLVRFRKTDDFLTSALQDTYTILKPGGIVGVVQHIAPDSASDEWADGSKGYLKKSFVIEEMKKAGFEFVASSDINLNPKDQPKEGDVVWRLPPSLATSNKDADLKAKYEAIGESTRMTLLFKKPE